MISAGTLDTILSGSAFGIKAINASSFPLPRSFSYFRGIPLGKYFRAMMIFPGYDDTHIHIHMILERRNSEYTGERMY